MDNQTNPDQTTADQRISDSADVSRERLDLIESLQTHRRFLRQTAEGLTDDQARHRSTVSELTVGGIIKHVALGERDWARFMAGDPLPTSDIDWTNPDPAVFEAPLASMTMRPDESLESIFADYDEISAATDDLVRSLDLDTAHRLPDAPWFPPNTSWSVRRVALHIVGETSQHSGHADVIREAIDGRKTMG